MSRRSAHIGDMVKTDRPVPITWSDRLIGGGVQRGRRGVVVARSGGRARVAFEGSRRALWVPARSLGVVAREEHSAPLLVPVRVAMMVFIIAPLVRFVVVYLWHHHGLGGFAEALATDWAEGLVGRVTLFATDPARALLHTGFMWVVTRLATR